MSTDPTVLGSQNEPLFTTITFNSSMGCDVEARESGYPKD
jgi:hypothetical protein